MGFVAIDAKADVQTSKKGRLTPAQHAQLNAWCLSSKTGILDIQYTGEKSERCEPTASVYSITAGIAVVTFRKGYICICGRLVECEEGTTVEINTNTTPTGVIVLCYDLNASGAAEFTAYAKSGTLIMQDLNEYSANGKYEFELLRYYKNGETIGVEERTTPYIQSNEVNWGTINGRVEEVEKDVASIEERLTALGFSEGDVWILGRTYTAAVKRQGNYVFFNIDTTGNPIRLYKADYEKWLGENAGVNFIKIAEPGKGNEFAPKSGNVIGYFSFVAKDSTTSHNIYFYIGDLDIQSDGFGFCEVVETTIGDIWGAYSQVYIDIEFKLCVGYEGNHKG